MSSVMWRRAAAKCSNGGLRAPSRRREARSGARPATPMRFAARPVPLLTTRRRDGRHPSVATLLDEFSDGVAANPAAG